MGRLDDGDDDGAVLMDDDNGDCRLGGDTEEFIAVLLMLLLLLLMEVEVEVVVVLVGTEGRVFPRVAIPPMNSYPPCDNKADMTPMTKNRGAMVSIRHNIS